MPVVARGSCTTVAHPHGLVVNDDENVLDYLRGALAECDEFSFGVAFMTKGGYWCLHDVLEEHLLHGKAGRMFVSDYQAFTQPEALRALQRLGGERFEARLLAGQDYHGKGYHFRRGDAHELLVGSANLTDTALKTNYELNLRLGLEPGSEVLEDFQARFRQCFDQARPLTDAIIDEYEERYQVRLQMELAAEEERRQQRGKDAFTPNRMQAEALAQLADLRGQGEVRALAVSATGTGKTVLAALDARASGARRILFVVHRRTIAGKALATFQAVMPAKTAGLYSGTERHDDRDMVFATVQTITRPQHLRKFAPDAFDYLVIDETHRAGAQTYQVLMDHFRPRFTLGMSATPARPDGYDIYKLFDHNIACDVRLQDALEEKLICPFHYFGIADMTIGGQVVDDNTDFRWLIADERIRRVAEAARRYGSHDGVVRGLIFCSRTDEADEVARKLGRLPDFHAVSLTSKNSILDDREDTLAMLEQTHPPARYNYVVTVDLLNEGVDIPPLNQLILLRPTTSPIVYVQQLGRGLRVAPGKDFLTVIDFIGSYEGNFNIPMALYGDQTMDKETLRRFVRSTSTRMIPGACSVTFDAVTRQRVYEAIDNANLQHMNMLKEDYRQLRARLGRIPMMMDFMDQGMRDPQQFVIKEKSYFGFVRKVEGGKDRPGTSLSMTEASAKLLGYLSREVTNGVRAEEPLLLWLLIKHGRIDRDRFAELCRRCLGAKPSAATMASVLTNLNLMFVTEKHKGGHQHKPEHRPVGCIHAYEIVIDEGDWLVAGSSLRTAIGDGCFREFAVDSARYALARFQREARRSDVVGGFIRYVRYSRKDVLRVLNWPKNDASVIYGYRDSADGSNCPVFMKCQKREDVVATQQYKDAIIAPDRIVYDSKSRCTLSDVKSFLNQADTGIRLPLFLKKHDYEGADYYFVGDMTYAADSAAEVDLPDGKDGSVKVVRMEFTLDRPLPPDFLTYFDYVPEAAAA